jgi:hypothetical protein
MWVCRAVLANEAICATSNFDDWNQCSNCGAPRQANSESFEPAENAELGTAIVSGAKAVADRAKQYAPVAAAVAEQARAKAGNIALHSRIATSTGVHPLTIVSLGAVLLIASMALPVVLNWPLKLTITTRNDVHEINQGFSTDQQLQGALLETNHSYDGFERVIQFVPNRLTDARKSKLVLATVLTGPVLITGSPVQMHGRGQTAGGGSAVGSVSMSLSNGQIFWLSALTLLVIFVIADLLIGDIYAMQKLLIILILVWIAYCLLIGTFAKSLLGDVAAQLFGSAHIDLTVGGLMTSPVKIGFIGLIYWMSSMLLRSLAHERSAAALRRRGELPAEA